jgi:hypothetical protein
MKVNELFKKVEFDDIWPVIRTIGYWEGQENKICDEDKYYAFLLAFCELKLTVPVMLESPLTIKYQFVERHWAEKEMGMPDEYAIDEYDSKGKWRSGACWWRLWNECLNYDIDEEWLREAGETTVAAHILHYTASLGYTWNETKLHMRFREERSHWLERGLFWVKCGIREVGYDGGFDFSDCEIIPFAMSCDSSGQVDERCAWMMAYNNHKAAWNTILSDRNPALKQVAWDYYPRGRVEIDDGKVIVYYHPGLRKMNRFENQIIDIFGLDDPAVKSVSFKADGSAHYTDGVGAEAEL